jgi:hypothetical protein
VAFGEEEVPILEKKHCYYIEIGVTLRANNIAFI